MSNASTGYGGGLYVRAGSLVTMTNSSVQQHLLPSAFDGRGAAMYLYDATVTLSNTQVLSNTTQNLGGGARLFGASRLDVLGGSVFRDNKALGGVGGAIAATNSADINANHAIFQSNTTSSHGGAIYLDSGTLDFSGAWDVRFNQAGGNGGAIACTGAADIDFNVTSGLFPTFLSGNQANGSGGAIYVSNTDNIQLYGTSRFPLTMSANTAGAHGGALYANSAAFFDVYGDIRLTGNTSSGNGGMAFLGGGARIWLDDYINILPQVLDNTAANGGAIYASDSPRVECDGAIFGKDNDGNQALSGSGGALYLSGSTLTADNCTFSSNQALGGNGGGIAAITSTVRIDTDYLPPVETTSRDSQPENPEAPQATGCDPRARQCSSLYDNTAGSNGGAVYSNGSALIVNNTYLHRNTAQRGGAIYQAGASATGVISNTLVYSNTSTLAFGAGIRAAGGAMTILHATLANNTGGAGYSPGSVQSYIYNTIIWGNSDAAYGSLTDTQCNIDQGGTAGPATNPLFSAPGGGENYRLQYSSPAIDACTSGLPTDLLNISRPQMSQYDMGAFEMTEPVYVEIAHLSPFASDPGTAVTITQDSYPLLIDFSFADSTGYLEIPSGDSLIEVWSAGASAPAISATVSLTPTLEYSLVAAGDGSRQPLELLQLLDNSTLPPPGKFHLRVGHLMPFETGSAPADLRLQDGAPVLTGLSYGDVSGFIPLDAGVYDLKITTPGGAITLVDPLPVSFAEGQVVTVFAVGDGSNQPLGVFAWNAGEPGALLPLAAYGVSLSPASAAQQGAPGETVTYTLHITNTGDTPVDFAITSTSTWSVAVPSSIVIAPGGSAQVEAQVTIPASATDGESDAATITVTAKDYPSASAQSTLTTTAVQPRVYLPIVINN
jgi:predicted outer membrane repeat protein